MKSKGKWPNSLTKLIQQVIQQNVKNDDNLKKNTDFFFKDRTIITLFWYIKHTQTHTHMQSLLKIINNSRYIFFLLLAFIYENESIFRLHLMWLFNYKWKFSKFVLIWISCCCCFYKHLG